jgi:hypothetical protein
MFQVEADHVIITEGFDLMMIRFQSKHVVWFNKGKTTITLHNSENDCAISDGILMRNKTDNTEHTRMQNYNGMNTKFGEDYSLQNSSLHLQYSYSYCCFLSHWPLCSAQNCVLERHETWFSPSSRDPQHFPHRGTHIFVIYCHKI